MLQVDSHGQFVLGDLGLIGAMRARATGKEWSGGAEGIAARALNMDDLGTEFATNTPVPTTRMPSSGPYFGISDGVGGR